jgi:hypothetical protein
MMKFGKTLFTVFMAILGVAVTLVFEPHVFCGMTLPIGARLLGWKAKAESARITFLGKVEIRHLEAVNPKKSRIALDSGLLEINPSSLFSGIPEIIQLRLKFGLVDLELSGGSKPTSNSSMSWKLPLTLREASIQITEGRLRVDNGAWILGGVQAEAQGWDGRTPREITGKIARLDWNGPGEQEIGSLVSWSVKKSSDNHGGDQWDLNLTTDVNKVVDLSPMELVVPCRLGLKGRVNMSSGGDWTLKELRSSWEGVGVAPVGIHINGEFKKSGEWSANLNLEPLSLGMFGTLFQSRGIKSMEGNLAGAINLNGATDRPILGSVNLVGQGVQILPSIGPSWPVRPSELAFSTSGSWSAKGKTVRWDNLQSSLGAKGQPQDFALSLNRPTVFHLGEKQITSDDPATVQWSLRGLELAALAPWLISPKQLKVQGGQLSASGQANIQGARLDVSGRLESRAMNAGGAALGGNLKITSATLDFRGNLPETGKVKLEQASLSVIWEGGQSIDLTAQLQGEWNTGKGDGWLMGDGSAGLAGLSKAWSGAQFWPEAGQAKLHFEYAGNLSDKGGGLVSLGLDGMRWPGDQANPWEAKISSEIKNEAGVWRLPKISLLADRGGMPLMEGQADLNWNLNQGEGMAKLDLKRAESALMVPILNITTPAWKWEEASVAGSLQFFRQKNEDEVIAKLHGAIKVETGIPEQSRPVDFPSVDGTIQASWPSGSSGKLLVNLFSLQARHRDGSDAVLATLDHPLWVEKKSSGQWKPAGKDVASASVQFRGWPLGLFTPLVFPDASESSVLGTVSGSVKISSDPKRGILSGEADLQIPDLMVHLPRVELPSNQVNLQALVSLVSDQSLQIQKTEISAQQNGMNWLTLTVEKSLHPGVLILGKMDLATASKNFPDLTPYLSGGALEIQAQAADPKEDVRKIGYSIEVKQARAQLPKIGALSGVNLKSQGIVEWQGGLNSLSEVNLVAEGVMGNLEFQKVSWVKKGSIAWEGGRISDGWMQTLSSPWLSPVRWLDGDVVLGGGFWEPGEHGASGGLDLTLLGVRLTMDPKLPPASLRLSGSFEYDNRTSGFDMMDTTLLFPDYRDDPVVISSLHWSPGSLRAQIKGGVLDLRGLLAQTQAWQDEKSSPKTTAPASTPLRMDLSASLKRIVVQEAAVGPIKIPRLVFGPEEIQLEPSIVQVQGGSISASVLGAGAGKPVQAQIAINKFPLGAILGTAIHDARGPIGGWADFQLSARSDGPSVEELRKSLNGQGKFRLYQAHLENLPSLYQALKKAGTLLGSSYIASSQINDLGSEFRIQGERISVPNLQVVGNALSASLDGWLNWFTQTLDFKLRFALTKEAMQSSGQLQGAMTQLIGKSNDEYTKIPGEARITGTLSNPDVKMEIGKMLAEGGINLLLNGSTGVLKDAGGAAGGAGGATGSILQGVGNLFKGF